MPTPTPPTPPTPTNQVKHDLLEFHDLHVAELYGARNRSHHEVDLVITLGGTCVIVWCVYSALCECLASLLLVLEGWPYPLFPLAPEPFVPTNTHPPVPLSPAEPITPKQTGDGLLMHANWLFQKSAPIILPVNLGSLGTLSI